MDYRRSLENVVDILKSLKKVRLTPKNEGNQVPRPQSSEGIGKYRTGLICLAIVIGMFACISVVMGVPNMLNTIMHTAHDLLLHTVFYLMAICVITGALGRIFVEFGVVSLLERILRPLMKPLFNLPGVASLGAVMTFLSDNPAIISLAKDKRFSSYFKKFQFISLTNFGTAFGMGLLVIVFMISNGFYVEPFIGLIGAVIGCIVSTRVMQHFVLKQYPNFAEEYAEVIDEQSEAQKEEVKETSLFTRILNSLLDGGKTGVDVGLSIIPGVLIISTLVMILTFGPGAEGYTGAAYEGVEFLPWAAGQINFVFDWLFGFEDPHLIAFPITALGAVGAALGLVPGFIEQGWVDGNAIAVFTAIGMCWSGYLSTHTAMLDALGYRKLTSKAILAHTIGGLVAAISAHWIFLIFALIFGTPEAKQGFADKSSVDVNIERIDDSTVCMTIERDGEYMGGRIFTDEEGDRYTDNNSMAYYISDCLEDFVVIRNESSGPKIAKFSNITFHYDSDMSDEMYKAVEEEVLRGFNEFYLDKVAMKMYRRPMTSLRDKDMEQLEKLVSATHKRTKVDGTTTLPNIIQPQQRPANTTPAAKPVVKTQPAAKPVEQKATPAKTTTTEVKKPTESVPVATTPAQPAYNNANAEYHIVESGDNYYNVAKRYGIKFEELKALNPGVDHARIDIGDKIRIR